MLSNQPTNKSYDNHADTQASFSLGRLGVYSGTTSGVAGQSESGMTLPVAEGTDEV